MDIRKARIITGHAGGNASKNSENYKISLPNSWIKKLGLNADNRDLVMEFDGEKITISKAVGISEFAEKKKSLGHKVKILKFYNGDILCTLIYADFSDKTVAMENYTDNIVKTAFGKKALPTWEDFTAFLEERCIPRGRSGLREYLEAIGLDEFDPIKIIEKTGGKMAEDDQWLELEDI